MANIRFFTNEQKTELDNLVQRIKHDTAWINLTRSAVQIPSEITEDFPHLNFQIFDLQNVNCTYITNYQQTVIPACLPVVFSGPHDLTNTLLIQRKINAHHLIKTKNLAPEFQQTYLYFNDQGHTITPLANQYDLVHLMNKKPNTYNMQEIKELIAQVLLAVREYHKNGLAHRDIHCGNFLAHEIDNKIWIKLSDIETAIEINANGTAITPDYCDAERNAENYRAPELFKFYANCKKNNTQPLMRDLNWKAVDCYALSRVIFRIITQLLIKTEAEKIFYPSGKKTIYKNPPEGSVHQHLGDLVFNLQKTQVSNRYTIEEILENKFFGETKEIRTNFFDNLIADTPRLTLNNFSVYKTHFEMNNFDILISQNAKQFHNTITTLTQRIFQLDETFKQPQLTTAIFSERTSIGNTFASLSSFNAPTAPQMGVSLTLLDLYLRSLITQIDCNLQAIAISNSLAISLQFSQPSRATTTPATLFNNSNIVSIAPILATAVTAENKRRRIQ